MSTRLTGPGAFAPFARAGAPPNCRLPGWIGAGTDPARGPVAPEGAAADRDGRGTGS
ncbi:hypothetical protein [Streptomyces sp.]|uniref:hypothetical protein n=1 Tax=Streptomyces sp. TaxID=1931 RepID=UPI0028119026|nr:hypothetical protein [Streptomyces sp.]